MHPQWFRTRYNAHVTSCHHESSRKWRWSMFQNHLISFFSLFDSVGRRFKATIQREMLMVMAQSEVINLVDHTVFQTKKSMVQYNCIPPLPAFRLWFPGFWFDLPLKLDIRCLSTTFFCHHILGLAESLKLCVIFFTHAFIHVQWLQKPLVISCE